MLTELNVSAIEPHPQNPRMQMREDVIESIQAGLADGFHPSYALQVWPNDNSYYVLSGHHRLEAAKRAGIETVPCFVRDDLDADAAYMVLATANAQGELSPLEIGAHNWYHVPKAVNHGRGQKGGQRDYATKIGKSEAFVRQTRNAFEVTLKCEPEYALLLDKYKHLDAIHALPESTWPAAVAELLKHGWSARETKEHVDRAREVVAEIPDYWGKVFLDHGQVATAVIQGTKPALFGRLLRLTSDIDAFIDEHFGDDGKQEFANWLQEDLKRAWDPGELYKYLIELQERAEEIEPFEGEYDVIVIDPPWPMEKIERDCRPNQVAMDYSTMSIDEIKEMNIPAAEDCHLFLWTTHKFLPDALNALSAWEFRYVCLFTWHKPGGFQPINLPQYNSEFVVYARKGSPKFSDTKAFFTCFDAKRTEHSAKPEEFYEVIRRVTAVDGVRRLDMFNRRKIDGFDVWGNEADA